MWNWPRQWVSWCQGLWKGDWRDAASSVLLACGAARCCWPGWEELGRAPLCPYALNTGTPGCVNGESCRLSFGSSTKIDPSHLEENVNHSHLTPSLKYSWMSFDVEFAYCKMHRFYCSEFWQTYTLVWWTLKPNLKHFHHSTRFPRAPLQVAPLTTTAETTTFLISIPIAFSACCWPSYKWNHTVCLCGCVQLISFNGMSWCSSMLLRV